MRTLRRLFERITAARRRGFRKVIRQRWRLARQRAMLDRAERYRRQLTTVTFVAVTGSTAKTMTTRMIGAILETAGPCVRPRFNIHSSIAEAVLATRPTHRFFVAETAISSPGYINRSLRLVSPQIGVVTNIGTDHRSNYGGPDGIAREKSKLVAALPADGVAVLNADDPRVIAMHSQSAARVITYGFAPEAMVRGSDVSGVWPDRLSLTVHVDGDEVHVRTRLCGAHWASAVLAAMGAAVAARVPLRAAAEAISTVEPAVARMSPVTDASGVTFIRDDWKAPLPSLAPAVDFLKAARAPRKIAVLGTVSDYPGSRERHYARAAKAMRTAADLLLLVGPNSIPGLRARRDAADDSILAFPTVRAASEHLDRILQPGDLVLIKGSNRADHLCRVVLNRTRGVKCWRARCGRRIFCDDCRLIDQPAQAEDRQAARAAARHAINDEPIIPIAHTDRGAASPVIVGLGNPGEKYVDTPHNVGQAVIDELALRLGATWQVVDGAEVGVVEFDGRPLRLVKLGTVMNQTGPALAALGRTLRFGPADCILVYDDVDMPFGSVRTRLSGSTGGHKGVASILHEYQTEDVRRVKLGVGRPGGKKVTADFLLTPFAAADRPTIENARQLAIEKVLHLVKRRACESSS